MEIERLNIIHNIKSTHIFSEYCVHIFYEYASETYFIGETYMVSFWCLTFPYLCKIFTKFLFVINQQYIKNLKSFKYSSTTITLYQTTITNNDSNTDIYHTYTNCYQHEDILDMTSLKIYVRIIPCTVLATTYFTTPSLDCYL